MRINMLLEELINIAKKTKTDFALSMNMTPSGLSKILTGKRVPSMKERKAFTKQTASYFAEAIYSPGCYLKLETLFPVIYDFESQDELQTFLSSAIAYALDVVFTEENSLNLSYTDRGMYYLGRKPVLNQLCVILSDQIVGRPDEPLEIFASLPLLEPAYSKMFQRFRLLESGSFNNVVLNYYFDDRLINGANGIGASELLLFITKLQKHFDLNFYEVTHGTDCFLLLKGKFLLLFNTQIDGTPLLIPIRHKSYLTVFYNSLVKKGAKKISYSKSEAIRFLEENPQFITGLQDNGIDCVYNFMSIGYLLEKQELEATGGNPIVCDAMLKLFNCILSQKTSFIVSIATMERFTSLGKAIVPLIGAIPFSPKLRVDYLRRFNEYLSEGSYDKMKIVDSELSNVVALSSQSLCLIYTMNDTFERERIHAFQSARLNSLLHSEIVGGNHVITDFSMELWHAYQDELTHASLDPNG